MTRDEIIDLLSEAVAQGGRDALTLAFSGKLPATDFTNFPAKQVMAEYDALTAEVARLREALTKIMLTAKSWEGRKEAPYWNLGDIASNALGTKED